MNPNPLPHIDALVVSADWEEIAYKVASAQRFADWVWLQPIVDALVAVARIKTFKDVSWETIVRVHEGAKQACAKVGIEVTR